MVFALCLSKGSFDVCNPLSSQFTRDITGCEHKLTESAPALLEMANLGVPVKLLHESLGHIITVELKTGEVRCEVARSIGALLILFLARQMYRGKLLEGPSAVHGARS